MHLIQTDESIFIDGERITIIDTNDSGQIRYSLDGFAHPSLVDKRFERSFLIEVKKINKSGATI